MSNTEHNIKLGSSLNYEKTNLTFKAERMLLKSNYKLKTISTFFSGRNCENVKSRAKIAGVGERMRELCFGKMPCLLEKRSPHL